MVVVLIVFSVAASIAIVACIAWEISRHLELIRQLKDGQS
jgi:hypothetical protein